MEDAPCRGDREPRKYVNESFEKCNEQTFVSGSNEVEGWTGKQTDRRKTALQKGV